MRCPDDGGKPLGRYSRRNQDNAGPDKDVICSARNCWLHFCATLLAAVFAGNERVLLGRDDHDTCVKAFHTGDVAFSSPAIFAGEIQVFNFQINTLVSSISNKS